MSALDDLIAQVENEALRERLAAEASRLVDGKKFGLVFEEHLPELTPLYGAPIRQGATVAVKGGKIADTWRVLAVEGEEAFCESCDGERRQEFKAADLVAVAEFGEPIYPCLTQLDSICRAPQSGLWHLLIEAENYHALQLLQYTCAGQVDCIYIDPPYNTGAKDWKYNNDYVDGADAYRHSKWLSMMKKRLLLAKKLLNPQDSVLIVTIDEKEYLHLGCLLEEMFPEARMQMVSSVVNPAGVSRGSGFSRTDEYIFFVAFGAASPASLNLSDDWRGKIKGGYKDKLRWNGLMRSGTHVLRSDRPNLFYPIFVYKDGSSIHSIGEPYYGKNLAEVEAPDGTVAIWPIRSNGEEGNWQISPEKLTELAKKGYVRLGGFTDRGMAISYLKRGEQEKVESGAFEVTGKRDDGSIIVDESGYEPRFVPGTQWWIPSHDATQLGTKLLNSILGGKRFDFPKSLYAVRDAIRFFTAGKPNALILDFFAGSATTLHAVNLLNAEDGGRRRCILVTNNEVSAEEAQGLKAQGLAPGDDAWEAMGIARYVAWPRTVCSIKGQDVNGAPLRGSYLGSDRPMSAGFEANAAFFRLEFLDKASVARREQFKALLPLFWLKAGGIGPCPQAGEGELPAMLIFAQNRFAVLLDEDTFGSFRERVSAAPEVETAFLVTDYEDAYRKMAADLVGVECFQVYRDYLDNFRIVHS